MEYIGLPPLSPEFMIVIKRIFLIVLLSGLIGLERESKNHPAGLRTHILVGVGSCLLMLLSIYGFQPFLDEHPELNGFDPSRIPSYVISGIGFLGAGTILVHRGVTVRGLTTAASIWVVAGLGLVVGIGMHYEAIFTTAIIVLTLFFLTRAEQYYRGKLRKKRWYTLTIRMQADELSAVTDIMQEHGLEVAELDVEQGAGLISCSFMVYSIGEDPIHNVMQELISREGIDQVRLMKK
ncbi:methyltransferase [Rossellomorea marisflavi]|jgi:putative Mg2+ transporter-C (MgtC) family protein|uniref:MgtC/SapB family protein n=1 Tax=Rossellomorea marisflavi TaxID=189381 RepID=UPI0025CAB18C|nr:methyltransferase [Rossellomorea marisflavi]